MDLISDNGSKSFIYKFAFLWMGLFLYLFIASDLLWVFGLFIVFGIPFFIYYLRKVQDIYYCGNSIKVKKGKQLIEIPVDEIESIYRSTYLQGCYRISFKKSTSVGRHIEFGPRKESFFKKHVMLLELMKRVNT